MFAQGRLGPPLPEDQGGGWMWGCATLRLCVPRAVAVRNHRGELRFGKPSSHFSMAKPLCVVFSLGFPSSSGLQEGSS